MKMIELITVGDLKFDALKELERDYIKRISFFSKFQVRPLRDIKLNDDEARKKKEGQLMMQMLEPRDYVIALDENGKRMDSRKFARVLEERINAGPDRIVFLIGGHAGLSAELDRRIDFKLSFSAMTFGHDVFRILFLEQLYRAFTILRGMTYHR